MSEPPASMKLHGARGASVASRLAGPSTSMTARSRSVLEFYIVGDQ